MLSPKDLLNHFFGPLFSVANAGSWSESALVLQLTACVVFCHCFVHFVLFCFCSGVSSSDLAPLIEPLFSQGAKQYRFVGGEFCGTHLLSEPAPEDAMKEAQEILLVSMQFRKLLCFSLFN